MFECLKSQADSESGGWTGCGARVEGQIGRRAPPQSVGAARRRVGNLMYMLGLVFVVCSGANAQKPPAVVPRPDPGSLSREVRLVLGLEGDGRYASRIGALNTLGEDIQPDDCEGLLWLLADVSAVEDVAPINRAGLLNDVMKKLRLQKTPPAGLEAVMMALYREKSRDTPIRDYALQQLMDWYPHARDRKKLVQCFLEALDEREGTIVGTAILALSRVLLKYPQDLDRGYVEKPALAIASDSARDSTARVSALQVCALLGVKKALPLARDVARSEEDTHLKISAIAALGYLGDQSDVSLIESLRGQPSDREYQAACSALKRLKKRVAMQ